MASDDIALLGRTFDVEVTPSTAAGVQTYLDLLLSWNQRINLTGARDVPTLLGEHLPDSFALVRLTAPNVAVVDIGSGGGLPALPFAVLRPDCRVTLVEPRVKRVAFLRTAVRTCGLASVEVLQGRVEDLERERAFDVAVSRATFAPEVWLGVGAALVRAAAGSVVVLSTTPMEAPSGLRLAQSIPYRTASGSPRWAGRFQIG